MIAFAPAIALGDRLSGSYLDLALNFAPLRVTRIRTRD